MDDSETVLFAGGTIDRAAHLRNAAGEMVSDPAARAAVLWRGKPVFAGTEAAPRLAWLALDHPVMTEAGGTAPIFLGLEAGAPRFAFDISAWEAPDTDAETMGRFVDTSVNRHPSLARDQGFLDLRASMSRLIPEDAGNAAAAKGIFAWHDTHRFCARCGGPSEPTQGGWQRTCTECGAHHFPRTDPVVIMLILHRGRVLLGRSPGWPETMYSLLAGFMEPGESIEEAVRRETREEAGIAVGQVGYLTSQPWPFPASLMIGCWGAALDDAISRDDAELADAFWASREDLMAERLKAEPRFRPARRGSIARFLIDRWLAGKLEVPLT